MSAVVAPPSQCDRTLTNLTARLLAEEERCQSSFIAWNCTQNIEGEKFVTRTITLNRNTTSGTKINLLHNRDNVAFLTNQGKGIKIDYVPAATPQINGQADRLNMPLMEITRVLLFNSGLEKESWG
ncbi:hypothetical protein PR048_012029 [Dryococelus australis]|uniref:Integrase catalytic domain-containing protein n=1 Tax=Dryococelus australis TaxID=614101 RepID=A0ABQ9HN70_9NEOP|nr:hypothetical protein PR048_012029 [Dryococelus australis]